MARFWNADHPFQVEAQCDQRYVKTLSGFDHHRVVVQQCWGILLTCESMGIDELSTVPTLMVVFHPAPERATAPDWVRRIVQAHPVAPQNIQAIVDQLSFRRDQDL